VRGRWFANGLGSWRVERLALLYFRAVHGLTACSFPVDFKPSDLGVDGKARTSNRGLVNAWDPR